MMKIEKIKETKKALLLKKEGVSFWVQRRWMNKEGELTPAGVKAFEKAKKEKAAREEEEKKLKGFKLWEGSCNGYPSWNRQKHRFDGYMRVYKGEEFAHIFFELPRKMTSIDWNRHYKGDYLYGLKLVNKNMSNDIFSQAVEVLKGFFHEDDNVAGVFA